MVELVDELTGDAEKLAIDGLHLNVDKLIFEESDVEGEDMRECLEVS